MKLQLLRWLLFLSFHLFVSISYCQSSFDKGFEEGYKKGYCYEKIGCTPPVPPIAPLPVPGESIDSYQDGYNRGFKLGLEASKENSKQGKFKTTIPDKTIDYMYKPTDLETKIASKGPQNFEAGMKRAQELYDQGKYSDCINLCNLICNITHMVSYESYSLIAISYDKLGNERQSKKYIKKAQKLLKKQQ